MILTSHRPLASSMFAPGVPEVMTEFHSSSTTLAGFVVSVYVLGYAFGPLIIAPLSELYGRLVVYHVSNVLFVVLTVACAVATNLNMLIGFRFLQGTFGSTPLTIGGGTIADMIVQEKRGGVIAIWALGPLMGPVIGPVAGGYLSQGKGWRWVFWVIAMAVSTLQLVQNHERGSSDAVRPASLPSLLSYSYARHMHPSSSNARPQGYGSRRATRTLDRSWHPTSLQRSCSNFPSYDQ